MENITSLNAAVSAGVPQSSLFGTHDMNEEKNIVDMPVVAQRQVCMDAQTQATPSRMLCATLPQAVH